jgi:hypothetical protein
MQANRVGHEIRCHMQPWIGQRPLCFHSASVMPNTHSKRLKPRASASAPALGPPGDLGYVMDLQLWLRRTKNGCNVLKQLSLLKRVPPQEIGGNPKVSEEIVGRVIHMLRMLKRTEARAEALYKLKSATDCHPVLLIACKHSLQLRSEIQEILKSTADDSATYRSGLTIARLAAVQVTFNVTERKFWENLSQHPEALQSHKTLISVSRAMSKRMLRDVVPPELFDQALKGYIACRGDLPEVKALEVLAYIATAVQSSTSASQSNLLTRIRKLVEEAVASAGPMGREMLSAAMEGLGACSLPLDDKLTGNLQVALRAHVAFMSHTQLSTVLAGFSKCVAQLDEHTKVIVLDVLEDTAHALTPPKSFALMRSLGRLGFKPKRRLMMALYESIAKSTALSVHSISFMLVHAKQIGLRVGRPLPDAMLRTIAKDAPSLTRDGVYGLLSSVKPVAVSLDREAEQSLQCALVAALPTFTLVRKIQVIEGLAVFKASKLAPDVSEAILQELLHNMPSNADEVGRNLRLLGSIGHTFADDANFGEVEKVFSVNIPIMSPEGLVTAASGLCRHPKIVSDTSWSALLDACQRSFYQIETNQLMVVMRAFAQRPSIDSTAFMKACSEVVLARAPSLVVWEAFRMLEAVAMLKVPPDAPMVDAVAAQVRVTAPQLDPSRRGSSSVLGAGIWGLAALEVEVDPAFMDTIVELLQRSSKVPRNEVRRLGWALAELSVPLGFFQTEAGTYLDGPFPEDQLQ